MPRVAQGTAVETRTGSTRLACGAYDLNQQIRCVAEVGHEGQHRDAWGQPFVGACNGRWRVESRGTGEYDVISESNSRVAGYMSLPVARLLVAAPRMKAVIDAVLHQMQHGEASDFIDTFNGRLLAKSGGKQVFDDAKDDLLWCREQLRDVLTTLT